MNDAEYVDVVSGIEYFITILVFIKYYGQPEFAREADRGKLHQYLEGAEGEVIIADQLHPGELQTSQPFQPKLAHDNVAPVWY